MTTTKCVKFNFLEKEKCEHSLLFPKAERLGCKAQWGSAALLTPTKLKSVGGVCLTSWSGWIRLLLLPIAADFHKHKYTHTHEHLHQFIARDPDTTPREHGGYFCSCCCFCCCQHKQVQWKTKKKNRNYQPTQNCIPNSFQDGQRHQRKAQGPSWHRHALSWAMQVSFARLKKRRSTSYTEIALLVAAPSWLAPLIS